MIDRGAMPSLIVATNNSDKAREFLLAKTSGKIHFKPQDNYALVERTDGKVQKVENYRGSGYLSQSSIVPQSL